MKRLIWSFGFAFNGLKFCLFRCANFRIHILAAACTITAGFLFHISTMEWMVCLLCIGSVLCMEILNTAIEQLCDVVHKDIHPGIKLTKDIAAGAVLFFALTATICGAIIFIPKIISIF